MIRFVLLSFMGTLAVVAATEVKPSKPEVQCLSPFTEVGGHCVHLEHNTKGAWQEMRQFCKDLGGDLVNLSDVQFYSDLLLYMKGIEFPYVHYWVGATDEEQEGLWVWTDGTPVRMGTPYWANYGCDNNQMPTGGKGQNCAILDRAFHYYFNDAFCTETIACPICEK